MVVKYGPHGKFLACPGFPECKNTKPYLEKIGVPCPKCGKEVVRKKTKKGRLYYGCEANPDCVILCPGRSLPLKVSEMRFLYGGEREINFSVQMKPADTVWINRRKSRNKFFLLFHGKT